MPKVIAINGSPEKSGRTAKFLTMLNIKDVFHLAENITPALEAIPGADTVVFATPVLWFNVSSLMKEMIERMEEGPDFPYEGKSAFFVAVCDEDGAQQAINQMMAPLNHMGFSVPPYASYIFNTSMANRSEDEWMLVGIDELGERLKSFQRQNMPALPGQRRRGWGKRGTALLRKNK
jgi:multimeric flavodoxin WrbA